MLPELGRRARGAQACREKSTGVATMRAVPPSATGTSTARARGLACGSSITSVDRLHRRPPHAGAVEDAAPLGHGPVAKISSSCATSSGDVLAAARRMVAKRGSSSQLGTLDGAHEVGPVAVALQAEQPEPAVVACRGTR